MKAITDIAEGIRGTGCPQEGAAKANCRASGKGARGTAAKQAGAAECGIEMAKKGAERTGMIQEYLLQEPGEKDAIEAYKPEGVQKRIFPVGNEKCWCVQFSIDGENEEIAQKLSEIDEYVQNTFHLTILEAGCSAYFNRRLYPLISEFEYNLRKLLYIKSAIIRDDKSDENIACLDSKDFGEIFSTLFIDKDFIEKVKLDIKGRNINLFSKEDVISSIECIDENTLCDKLLGKNSVPILKKRFNDIRTYRNDVMHSHYTNWKMFKEILSLYEVINNELNDNLNKIYDNDKKYYINPTFNQILEGALRAQEQLSAVFDVLKPSLEQVALPLAEFHETIKEIACNVAPDLQRALEQIRQLSKVYPQILKGNNSQSDQI